VANVVLAVFAIITAVLAGLAFRKQAREVSDQTATRPMFFRSFEREPTRQVLGA
jgi:hypothetical protein